MVSPTTIDYKKNHSKKLRSVFLNSFGQSFSRSTRLVQKNIYEEPLEICSLNPITGWFRDGYARTDYNDRGIHVVCATMTSEFLGTI